MSFRPFLFSIIIAKQENSGQFLITFRLFLSFIFLCKKTWVNLIPQYLMSKTRKFIKHCLMRRPVKGKERLENYIQLQCNLGLFYTLSSEQNEKIQGDFWSHSDRLFLSFFCARAKSITWYSCQIGCINNSYASIDMSDNNQFMSSGPCNPQCTVMHF